MPTGFVWVVRDVSVTSRPPGGEGQGVPSLIMSAGGRPVWRTPLNGTYSWVIYEARDVRWVLAAGELLSAIVPGVQWSIRVTGYQLTA